MDTLLVVGQLQLLDGDLSQSLEGSGFWLIETRNAEEAVQLCRRTEPALTFVEVDSAQGDNLELLPRLRGALKQSGRIVAICNQYSEALDDHCERLGANLTLPKPDDRTDVKLFLRGLMTLIPADAPGSPEDSSPESLQRAERRLSVRPSLRPARL